MDAKVKRVVIDDISLRVNALEESEAQDKVKRVLEKFPDPHEEEGIDYCYIESRENIYAEPISVEIRKERGVGG